MTDRRVLFGNVVFPVWSITTIQTETVPSPHSPNGCLPALLAVLIVAAPIGGWLAFLGGMPGGLAMVGVGVVLFLLGWLFLKAIEQQQPWDSFQLTVGTSSGQSFVFWSENQDEVDDVVRALNESVANYQKN